MDLGRVGIYTCELHADEHLASGAAAAAAAELEELGYGAIWLGVRPGVEHAAPLLAATSRIVVATSIVSIWDYEPAEVAATYTSLMGEHPGRFLLGLGVSHAILYPDRYRRPVTAMQEFLDGLDAAPTLVPTPQRVLAALGPRMLETSRDRAAGAHPYLVTPEHTRRAREILGPDRMLAPEVKVVIEDDPARARALARQHLELYLSLPNNTNNLRWLGFTEEDLSNGGSDHLVESVFAFGDAGAICERVAAHHAAGADHVGVQIITAEGSDLPRREWRDLAAMLSLQPGA
jgi:probable F420-dependent oxidoreductase